MFHGFARSVLSAEAGRDMGARFALPVLQPLSLAFTAAQLGQVKADQRGLACVCIAVDLVIAGNRNPAEDETACPDQRSAARRRGGRTVSRLW